MNSIAPEVSNPIAASIHAHRLAVITDESSFHYDGEPKSKELAAATERAEISAFQSFVFLQCETPHDVQEKIGYLLEGTIGQRDSLLSCIIDDRYNTDVSDLLEDFLRSLVLPGVKAPGRRMTV